MAVAIQVTRIQLPSVLTPPSVPSWEEIVYGKNLENKPKLFTLSHYIKSSNQANTEIDSTAFKKTNLSLEFATCLVRLVCIISVQST